VAIDSHLVQFCVHVSKFHAINEATGKTEAKEVVRVFERQSNELVVISLANGEEIRTTPEHPFSVEGKGWTAARDLKSFDRLATTSSTSSSIDSVQWMRTPSKVYNFEVEDYHTYFVSANGTEVWVHNACTPPPAAKITGFSQHALDRSIGAGTNAPGTRPGVSPRAMLDAVRNPTKTKPDRRRGGTKYIGKEATVVLRDDGIVITTWPRATTGWRGPRSYWQDIGL
jgi:hypothetical protein